MRPMLYAGALLVAACGDVDLETSTLTSEVTTADLAINVDPNGPGLFGAAVAARGTDILVGATRNPGGGATDTGVVYVLDGDTGALKLKIRNPEAASGDRFGTSIAVFPDGRVAVGAPLDNPSIGGVEYADAGSVYVFDQAGTLVTTIRCPGATAGDAEEFGASLAVIGNSKLLVGAPGVDVDGATAAGRAWIVDPSTGGVLLQLDNPVPGPATLDRFGAAVTLYRGYALVGAPADDTTASNGGTVYGFDVTTGALAFTLATPGATANVGFGSVLATASDTRLLVSGAFATVGGLGNAGEVFMYDEDLLLNTTIVNPTPIAGELFGKALGAYSSEVALIGSPEAYNGFTARTGEVALVSLSTGAILKTLVNPSVVANDQYGYAVGAVGNAIVIGNPFHEHSGSTDAGMLYVIAPPRADAKSVTTKQDTALAVTLTGLDPQSDALAFSVGEAPASGALSGTPPNLVYTPAAGYHGADSFTYTASDGAMRSAAATVAIVVNDAPSATPQSVTVAEDGAVGVTLAGTDANGDSVTFAVTAQPAHGALAGSPPALTYTPAANYTGADALQFTATDGFGASSSATVAITVTAVNDPPAATAQAVTTNEDTARAITLAGTDVDGDPLTFAIASAPAHGTLIGTPPNVTYTPVANYGGADAFTFTAKDPSNATSTAATVAITVTPLNDPPSATAANVTTLEDTAKAITLAAIDNDGDALTFSITAAPAHGTLTGTPPNVSYTPAAKYAGADAFTFQASDGTAATTATIAITVTAVNDPPVASPQTRTTAEDTTLALVLIGSDVETAALTYAFPTLPAHGTLSGTAPNVTYTPAANFTGSDSFTFTVTDAANVTSPAAAVAITVTAVNDPPAASGGAVTTAEDTDVAIALAGSDVDGDALAITVTSPPAHGVLAGTPPDMTYTPAANYHGTDVVAYRVFDGQVEATASVAITIDAVNDAPLAQAQSVAVAQGQHVDIVLAASDVDGDPVALAIANAPAHGTLSGTAPNVRYTPAAQYAGGDAFTFVATDGSDATEATIAIAVVNAEPAITSLTADDTTPGEGQSVAFAATATDPGGDALVFAWDFGDGGTAVGTTANHAFGRDGVYTVTLTVTDSEGGTATGTRTIFVENLPPAVVTVDVPAQLDEGSVASFAVTATDPGGDALTYAWTFGDGGSASGAAVTHTFADDEGGPFTVVVTVTDADGDATSAQHTTTVRNVAPSPSAPATQTATVGDVIALDLVASDPGGAADPLAWTAVFLPSGATLTPAGHFTYAASAAGTFSATVEVADDDGGAASMTFAIDVAQAPGDAGMPDAPETPDAGTPDAGPAASADGDGGCCSTSREGASGSALLAFALLFAVRRRRPSTHALRGGGRETREPRYAWGAPRSRARHADHARGTDDLHCADESRLLDG